MSASAQIQEGVKAFLLTVIVSVAFAAMVVALNPWMGNVGFTAVYVVTQLLFLAGIVVVGRKKQ